MNKFLRWTKLVKYQTPGRRWWLFRGRNIGQLPEGGYLAKDDVTGLPGVSTVGAGHWLQSPQEWLMAETLRTSGSMVLRVCVYSGCTCSHWVGVVILISLRLPQNWAGKEAAVGGESQVRVVGYRSASVETGQKDPRDNTLEWGASVRTHVWFHMHKIVPCRNIYRCVRMCGLMSAHLSLALSAKET